MIIQKQNIKAVILDMDGLMIDSEQFHCRAFDLTLRKYGFGLTQEENDQRYVGIGDVEAAKDMIQRYNLKVDYNTLCKQKDTQYIKLTGDNVIPQPGLIELLKYIKKNNYKTAIASGSSREIIELVLKKLKIEKYFDDYCSSSEITNGKPSPDIFLLAATKLNIEPGNCLVLEDAISGLQAARNANMFVYIVPSRETKNDDFSSSDMVFERLDLIIEFL